MSFAIGSQARSKSEAGVVAQSGEAAQSANMQEAAQQAAKTKALRDKVLEAQHAAAVEKVKVPRKRMRASGPELKI